MSITLLIWLSLFFLLTVLAFWRPVWGVALYMLSFFAFPPIWWWGKPIVDYRWNLYAGVILLVATLLSPASRPRRTTVYSAWQRYLPWIIVGILVNATLVHLLLARYADISAGPYTLMAKFVLLFLMMTVAIRTERDLRIALLALVLGAGYIGYEATINHRGHQRKGRLEGIGAPGAVGANQCASLMVTVLPITGAFFLRGRRIERMAMLPIAPFIVNVVLLCDSRAAFLAMIASGVMIFVMSPRRLRRQVLKLLALGAVAVWLLLGDPRIVERFQTTFTSAEERDTSASHRIDYWIAGMRMIADHPLGAGGNGFKRVYGPSYIHEVNDQELNARAVHNGFINEACEWGIQGFLLRMALMGGSLILLWRTARNVIGSDTFGGLLGCTLIAGIVGFLVTCLFGDRLDNEWGYWMAALAVAYARVYSSRVPSKAAARRPARGANHARHAVLARG